MTTEEKKDFENKLESYGYKKLYAAKSNTNDDFEWYKVFRNSKSKLQYQIFFQFWDFSKYGYELNSPWSISIEIIPDVDGRQDLELSVDWFKDIERVEKIAEGFYKFIKRYA